MSRRRMMHPEAKRAHLALEAAAKPAPAGWTATGWGRHYGYRITLYRPDGRQRHRFASTYEQAVFLRDEGMKTGEFEKAWIREREWAPAEKIARKPPPGDGG